MIPDPVETLAALRARGDAILDEVILHVDPGVPLDDPSPESAPGRAEISAEGPREVRVSADLPRPGFLVLSDVYYPGWKAYVDGHVVPILRANHAFRAIWLREGRHDVRFVYAPRSFAVGWRVSAAAAALVAAALIRTAVAVRRRTVSTVRR